MLTYEYYSHQKETLFFLKDFIGIN